MIRIIMALSFMLFQPGNTSPIVLNWMILQRVDTRPVSIPGIEGLIPLPVFSQKIKSFDGKLVDIDGFVIPLDKTGKTIALSGYSMAECFFCGKAGPASVMTVKLKKPDKKYKTDQLATFRGRLRLNDKDPKELFYILEDGFEINN